MDNVYHFIKNNGNISIAATILGSPPSQQTNTFDKLILELDQNGAIVYDSIYNQSGHEGICDFIKVPNSDHSILLCYPNFEGGNIKKEINVLDENYDLVFSKFMDTDGFYRSIRAKSDSVFLLSSREYDQSYDPTAWFSSIRKLNVNYDELGNLIYGSPDSLSYPAKYNSLAFISDNNIYSGFTFNLDFETAYSSFKSYFTLSSITSDLSLNWKRFYGGDAYYNLVDIKTDDDGGCLMVGTKYNNGNEGPFSRDLVFIKVNPEGLITSTNNDTEIPIKNAIILPNPGKEYMELHTGAYPATLLVHNLNGRLVLEEAITSNISRVNTMELSSGIYIWSLIKEGKVVETGKWVRE
ncbi:T9SS type A sorting domain-containing protein [Lentimicrobium sp. S6]|uniref:T9SS type A sorting domain-containing protein n=1 Tax=Lentimicrobium sp. S6 TaxID=2735872 RepID=UPI001552DE3D|nr:T9SS type A sorting domain-containing protein [Lentimicrobium sp. S6]NPD45706.1 T9SS type A sorting domain-containing protein [Lentimicrobium sp. S6]